MPSVKTRSRHEARARSEKVRKHQAEEKARKKRQRKRDMDASWPSGPNKSVYKTSDPSMLVDGRERHHNIKTEAAARRALGAEQRAIQEAHEAFRRPMQRRWEQLRAHNHNNKIESRQLKMQLFVIPARNARLERERVLREAKLQLERKVMGPPLKKGKIKAIGASVSDKAKKTTPKEEQMQVPCSDAGWSFDAMKE